jgi:hypothetical protein
LNLLVECLGSNSSYGGVFFFLVGDLGVDVDSTYFISP